MIDVHTRRIAWVWSYTTTHSGVNVSASFATYNPTIADGVSVSYLILNKKMVHYGLFILRDGRDRENHTYRLVPSDRLGKICTLCPVAPVAPIGEYEQALRMGRLYSRLVAYGIKTFSTV